MEMEPNNVAKNRPLEKRRPIRPLRLCVSRPSVLIFAREARSLGLFTNEKNPAEANDYVLKVDGKDYAMPLGAKGKVILELKPIDAQGDLRQVKPDSPEGKAVLAALKNTDFTKGAFESSHSYTVQSGDNVWNVEHREKRSGSRSCKR